MNKARVSVGYTRSDLEHYRTWVSPVVSGADIEALDGLGNIIKVAVREDGIGFRITLNGEKLAAGGAS